MATITVNGITFGETTIRGRLFSYFSRCKTPRTATQAISSLGFRNEASARSEISLMASAGLLVKSPRTTTPGDNGKFAYSVVAGVAGNGSSVPGGFPSPLSSSTVRTSSVESTEEEAIEAEEITVAESVKLIRSHLSQVDRLLGFVLEKFENAVTVEELTTEVTEAAQDLFEDAIREAVKRHITA